MPLPAAATVALVTMAALGSTSMYGLQATDGTVKKSPWPLKATWVLKDSDLNANGQLQYTYHYMWWDYTTGKLYIQENNFDDGEVTHQLSVGVNQYKWDAVNATMAQNALAQLNGLTSVAAAAGILASSAASKTEAMLLAGGGGISPSCNYQTWGIPPQNNEDIDDEELQGIVAEAIEALTDDLTPDNCVKETDKVPAIALNAAGGPGIAAQLVAYNATHNTWTVQYDDETINYITKLDGTPVQMDEYQIVWFKPTLVQPWTSIEYTIPAPPCACGTCPATQKPKPTAAGIKSDDAELQYKDKNYDFSHENNGEKWDGGLGTRLNKVLWCGFGSEFTVATRWVNHEAGVGYQKNGCNGAQITFSGTDSTAGDSWHADVPTFKHKYPVNGPAQAKNAPLSSYGLPAGFTKNPVTGTDYVLPNKAHEKAPELPSTGPKQQKLNKCRALAGFIDSDYIEYNLGLQVTLTKGAHGSLTNDHACRQHDFCPLANGGGPKGKWMVTCACDSRLWQLSTRPAITLIFEPNPTALNIVSFTHPCVNLTKKCQKRGFLKCKKIAKGGGYKLEWTKKRVWKYHHGDRHFNKAFGPVGRGSQVRSICAPLRQKGEGVISTGVVTASPAIGDGICQAANNNEQWGYDGGDCCPTTCVPQGPGTCTVFDCKQPGCPPPNSPLDGCGEVFLGACYPEYVNVPSTDGSYWAPNPACSNFSNNPQVSPFACNPCHQFPTSMGVLPNFATCREQWLNQGGENFDNTCGGVGFWTTTHPVTGALTQHYGIKSCPILTDDKGEQQPYTCQSDCTCRSISNPSLIWP